MSSLSKTRRINPELTLEAPDHTPPHAVFFTKNQDIKMHQSIVGNCGGPVLGGWSVVGLFFSKWFQV